VNAGARPATVYSRPGCHLCDEAITELAAGFPELEVTVVDIDGDDELLKRYLERIPVVEIDGDEVSELVLDTEAVRTRLLKP
jgi:glutaredoxin